MEIRHNENTDVLSVIMDEPLVITEGGIILSKAEATMEVEKQRTATVYSAAEFYCYERVKSPTKTIPIRVKSPVKAGDRVLLERYAGLKHVTVGDQVITFIRYGEILGVIEE